MFEKAFILLRSRQPPNKNSLNSATARNYPRNAIAAAEFLEFLGFVIGGCLGLSKIKSLLYSSTAHIKFFMHFNCYDCNRLQSIAVVDIQKLQCKS